jgi:IPT/TIG domain
MTEAQIQFKNRSIRLMLFSAFVIASIVVCPRSISAQNKNTNNASSTNTNAKQAVSPEANANKADTTVEPNNKPAQMEAGPAKSNLSEPNQNNAPPDPNADLSSVKVTGVSGNLALYNTITVTVANLPVLLKAAGNDYSKIILFLDGYPLKAITPRQGDDSNDLRFDLRRTDDADTKNSWNSLLGRPPGLPFPKPRKVSVTVGKEGQPLEPMYKGSELTVINPTGYWIFSAGLVLFLIVFIRWARKSDVLRVGPALKDSLGRIQLQRYSLGRCQMAYWFILVAASYVFIWMVTSEYGVLPGSVLGLIGISAGTALGAVIIDSSGPGSVAASVTPQPTGGFFNDIFSDDQGKITFHRFQILAWSIVLGIIFIASVYNVLTMPDFPSELLALMGISSGTYIGFKFPEKQDAQNRAAATGADAGGDKPDNSNPSIGSPAPNTGPIAGGTPVTITGTAFVAGANVTFGGAAATSVIVNSGTSISAVTPAHTAGAVDVEVINPNNRKATLKDGFTYK